MYFRSDAKFSKMGNKCNSDTIIEMKLSYRKILDLKEYINDTFSPQILSTTVDMFTEFVFFAFLNVVTFQHDIRKYRDPRFWTVLFFFLALVIRLLVLVYACEKLKVNLEKTGKIVHMFAKEQDSETKQEVKILN